jgi:hypothetical protein
MPPQVLDGLWTLEGDTVRPVVFDYDRLIAIGDHTWQDYTASVPITVHAIDPGGYVFPSNGPAVGILLRRPGHSADGHQPMEGVYPLGAIGIHRWTASYNRFEIFGNNGSLLATAPTSQVHGAEVQGAMKTEGSSAP